jgi:hypothetical protein
MDKNIADKRTLKVKNDAIMKLQAVFCNNIEFNLTNMGLRLTFGEQPLMEGELPTHRVAVFLPGSMVEPLVATLAKVLSDHKANQAKPRCL